MLYIAGITGVVCIHYHGGIVCLYLSVSSRRNIQSLQPFTQTEPDSQQLPPLTKTERDSRQQLLTQTQRRVHKDPENW